MGYNYYKFAVKSIDGTIYKGLDAIQEMNKTEWSDVKWEDNIPVLLPLPSNTLPPPIYGDNPLYLEQMAVYKADKSLKKALYILAIKTKYPLYSFVLLGSMDKKSWAEVESLGTRVESFVNSTILVTDKMWVMRKMVGL